MNKIYLSITEAEELLPIIRKKLRRLIGINKALSILNSLDLEYEDEYETLMQDIKINKKFHKLSFEFYNLMEELHENGCILKDIEEGTVDFYSFFEGREIFLCWNIKEENIKYWHELECGRQCKKPVSIIKNNLARPKKEFFIR
ncbi:MAG: DUF2203 domain-containing protein [Nanoarchaeota archaeon]|nr:DUF2203 domain-containing protein [Nanoarchaeota archaeon]MBU1269295.1 DUF2203 domain-containing protein [Nanoarchaeota archaeon]MBU1603768.1 DUF2203 domain-containing protein [Nanoarchaeota archaeon]MBU2443893.1 DUF2203 domain-containing protein [Nanoarchaeota archaeon]